MVLHHVWHFLTQGGTVIFSLILDALKSGSQQKLVGFYLIFSHILQTEFEQYNLKHKTKELTLKVGDVVLIQNEERNHGQLQYRNRCETHQGTNRVMRGAKLRAGKSYLERTIQLWCPMELSCDMQETPLSSFMLLKFHDFEWPSTTFQSFPWP